MIHKAQLVSRLQFFRQSFSVSENVESTNSKKLYYNTNVEKLRAANKAYCKSEKVRAQQLEYKAAHKNAVGERMSAYREQNKEKLASNEPANAPDSARYEAWKNKKWLNLTQYRLKNREKYELMRNSYYPIARGKSIARNAEIGKESRKRAYKKKSEKMKEKLSHERRKFYLKYKELIALKKSSKVYELRFYLVNSNEDKLYLKNLASRLGIDSEQLSDWYKIPERKLRQFARAKYYLVIFGSLFEILKAFYPNFPWVKDKFLSLPKDISTNPNAPRQFLDKIAPHVNVNSPHDWYRVSRRQIIQYGGPKLWALHGSKMVNLLQAAYPEISWEADLFVKKSKRTTQRQLATVVSEAYPGKQIIENYWLSTVLPGTEGKIGIEIDVWVPELKLGFEYQGEQHYFDMSKVYGPSSLLQLYQNRDKVKTAVCEYEQVRLIAVPYWWDASLASLQELIHSSAHPPHWTNKE